MIIFKKRLVTIPRIAKYLNLSIHTIRALVKERQIPYIVIGQMILFDLTRIDTWLEDCTFEPIKLETSFEKDNVKEKIEQALSYTPPKKSCSQCREEKRLDLFYKDKKTKDGRTAICKACRGKKAADSKKKRVNDPSRRSMQATRSFLNGERVRL